MEIDIPVFDWFEEPIKESVRSVFNSINSKVESLDLFRKYRDVHFEILKNQVGSVKILGMQHPIELQNLYYPAVVSTDIRRRIYAPEWREIDGPETKTKAKASSNTEAGDKFIANN
jgi:hypothetical protein